MCQKYTYVSIDALSELIILVPDQPKSNNVKHFAPFYLVCKYEHGRYSDYLPNMYGNLEPHTTWPPSLVVNVSDFGNRGPGSIPGWAPIIPCLFFLLLFQRENAEVLHSSNM